MKEDNGCLETLVLFLQEHHDNPGKIHRDAELADGLGLSSIEVMEILEKVEDHFDISVPLNDLIQVRTVADLAVQIDKQLQG